MRVSPLKKNSLVLPRVDSVDLARRPVLDAAWDLLPAVCGAYKGPKGKLCSKVEVRVRSHARGMPVKNLTRPHFFPASCRHCDGRDLQK